MGNIDICGLKSANRKAKEAPRPAPAQILRLVRPVVGEMFTTKANRAERLDAAQAVIRKINLAVSPFLASKKTLTIDQLDKLINELRDVDWYLALAGCYADSALGPREAFQIVESFQFVCANLLTRIFSQREPDSRWVTDLTPLFGNWSLQKPARSSNASIQDSLRRKAATADPGTHITKNGSRVTRQSTGSSKPNVP